jgi:GNAT superfamily N-acetyltransferase
MDSHTIASQPFSSPEGTALPHLSLPSWEKGLAPDLSGPGRLRDGVVVTVRPIHDDDVQRLRAFHLCLSPQTLYLRFAHVLGGFPWELATWLTCVDGDHRMAFVATDPTTAADTATAGTASMKVLAKADTNEESEGRAQDHETWESHGIIGVARYEWVRPQVAEMAAVVADHWQGRGLGPLLLYRLAMYARRRDYATFIALVSSRNERVIRSLKHFLFPFTLKRLDDDTVLVSVDLTLLNPSALGER